LEWTILSGDAIAGGSVYHLADGWDAGDVAAQDWCFVLKGETARELWERALAPMGLALLARVVRHAREHGVLPAQAQDPRFATKAPMIKRAVTLTEEAAGSSTSLVVTVMGPDRPGIVSLLSDRAQRFGANWTASRMEKLAGQFAGMVHFEVPRANAAGLAQALADLEASGLKVVVASSENGPSPAGQRALALELIGDDQVGIVSRLTALLAERNVSIEHIHTELLHGEGPRQTFKVRAHLMAPAAVDTAGLKQELETLASAMMLDVALGERSGR
jgi:glycine cleavage system regulatory protein